MSASARRTPSLCCIRFRFGVAVGVQYGGLSGCFCRFSIKSYMPDCSAISSPVHFGGVARALARRGRISLESETGGVLTVYV